MPDKFSPGVLYVSDEYSIAGHLCACGCGNEVMTPLGPAEWSFSQYNARPSLRPSIGNWQLPCRSHYFITDGQVLWAEHWSDERVAAGQRAEHDRREAYYTSLEQNRGFWAWVLKLIRKLLSWW